MTALEHLQTNWAALLREDRLPPQFHKNRGVYFIRNYARPIAEADGAITLEFTKAIYKDQVERLDVRKEIEKLFEHILTKPYRVKCALAAPGTAPPGRPGASGGHLVQALKDMGARVVATPAPDGAPEGVQPRPAGPPREEEQR